MSYCPSDKYSFMYVFSTRFLGDEAFQTGIKVLAKKIKRAPEIKFFKRNGIEKPLCTLVMVLVSQAPQVSFTSVL